ncbi:hypothetical protein FQN51_004975 [Onygenales sp. PD_10]|nr:hypothetical protein FQN51_004975 [Onygenales sp. PD_10]
MGSTASPHARLVFKSAFERFTSTIAANNPTIVSTLNASTLSDVYDAVKTLEEELAQRRSLKNMRRLQPLFDGLRRYSQAVEVLCNGTPYVSWIWAPVTLILRLASDHENAIDKLIATYSTIGEVLPRFNRLGTVLRDSDFQEALAVVYSDILEFHEEAYKFFQKSGWKIFFSTLWARFDRRFKTILESLAKHSEMIDKEANSIDIARAQEWREKASEDMRKQEEARSHTQFNAVLAWLDVKDYEQEEELDWHSSLCHNGSCDWIQNHSTIKPWLCPGDQNLILWIKGKPGAGWFSVRLLTASTASDTECATGKSVLTSVMVRSLENDPVFTVLYYFCSYYSTQNNKSSHILRSLTAQILRRNVDLSSYVYDEYIKNGLSPSLRQLKRLLPVLLSAVNHVRLVIDGIDEFPEKDQKQIISDLIPLACVAATGAECKLLFSSRDIQPISRTLARQRTVSLSDERKAIDGAIKSFIRDNLTDATPHFRGKGLESIIDTVEEELIQKANGMYLWTRLVLRMLENVHTARDLLQAVRSLPTDLKKLYERIVSFISHQYDPCDQEKAIRIFRWLSLAERPLRKHELLDAASLHTANTCLNEETRVWENVIDLCKPLVEEMPNGTIVFIHFTVKEYLLTPSSGLAVNFADAHHDIAFACLAYLVSSFELIDSNVTEQQKAIRVGKSFHGLHLYANEYWFKHLLLYANTQGGLPEGFSQFLVDILVLLSKTNATFSFADGHQVTPNTNYTPSPLPEDVTIPLQPHPEAVDFLQRVHGFREYLKKEQDKSGEELDNLRFHSDPTMLSRINKMYTTIVQTLLKANAYPGFNREDFATFKQNFSSSAFICRYPDCHKRTDGFASRQDRADHEQLRHGEGIKCSDPSCRFSSIGFPNAAALKRHMREYHPMEQTALPHRFKRKRRNTSPEPNEAESRSREGPDHQSRSLTMDDSTSSNRGSSAAMNLGGEMRPEIAAPFDLSFADIDNPDILEQFDFDSFLANDGNTFAPEDALIKWREE